VIIERELILLSP